MPMGATLGHLDLGRDGFSFPYGTGLVIEEWNSREAYGTSGGSLSDSFEP